MAIYKLSEVIGFVRGNTPFQKKDLLQQGEFMALHYGKTYQKNIINNDFEYFVNKEFYKEKQLIEKGDTILITTSETIKELGKPVYYDSDWKGLLGGEQIKVFPKNQGTLLKKYLFLYFSKHWMKIQRFQTGLKVFRVKGDDLKYMQGFLPNIKTQQKIIDIIEPKEKLFLKYSNCVRINNFENTKKDINQLIDIIEPIETQIKNINSSIKKIKQKIILSYNLSKTDVINFMDCIKITNQKYKNQVTYLATNGFSELKIDLSKKQILDGKIPSRANLTPTKKSIIFSKLIGENKVFYFDSEPNFVVSTGFYNIKSEYSDHIVGFLLSKSFIKQKEIFSSGTTMIGLNNQGMKNIKIKIPTQKSNEQVQIINKLINIKIKLLQIQKQLIQLLIK